MRMSELGNSLPSAKGGFDNPTPSQAGASFFGKLKGRWPIVLGALGSIAIFTIFLYAVLSYSRREQELQPTPTSTLALTPIQTPIVGTPTPTPMIRDETGDWKIYKNEECNYQIKWPNDWVEIEHSSNFPCAAIFKAPDASGVQVAVEENKYKNLDQYLEELDEIHSVGYEGQPSVKVVDSKNATVGSQESKERTEKWLAAGFTTLVTYTNYRSKIYSFTILSYGHPGAEDLTKTRAAEKFHQILSTFKFLD